MAAHAACHGWLCPPGQQPRSADRLYPRGGQALGRPRHRWHQSKSRRSRPRLALLLRHSHAHRGAAHGRCPLVSWKSKATGGLYPIAWELSIPSLALTARITTLVENQELVLLPIAYWEGLIDVRGTRAGREVKGHGYLELTGYAGALVGLSA